jgi:hypothetical protein
MKTPEEMAKDWVALVRTIKLSNAAKFICKRAFLAGYEAGREMSHKEIFDHYIELRKKNGDKEPATHYERFKITLKGIF